MQNVSLSHLVISLQIVADCTLLLYDVGCEDAAARVEKTRIQSCDALGAHDWNEHRNMC